MNISQVLSQVPCFSNLTMAETRELLTWMEVVPFQRNQQLWREGEVISRVGILIAGRLKMVKHQESGPDLIVDLPVTGRIVGLMADARAPQTAGAVGLGQGALAMIEREHLLAVLGQHRLAALRVEQEEDSDSLYLHLLQLPVSGDDETRLATLLLRLAITDGELIDAGVQLTLPLSRQDLASLINASLGSTIRILSRWNQEQLVLTTRNGLLITSVSRLMTRASFGDDTDPVPGPPVGSFSSSRYHAHDRALHVSF